MRARHLDGPLFDEVAGRSGKDLISIFIPTHHKGPEVAQDRIHLKSQLSEAEEGLGALGYKPRERETRLAAAWDLLDDLEFWEHQREGLAVFIDEDGSVNPVSSTSRLSPASMVMSVFMLRPLIADIHAVTAPVLALTKDAVALFSATESDVEQLDVQFPSYDNVNWFVDREKQRQQHPDHVGTERSLHGHEPSARADEDLARFLREIDAALRGLKTETPLIVLGDDHIVARFANHSGRDTVSPENSGVTAPFTIDEIRSRVTETLARMKEQLVTAARSEAVDRLGEGSATADIDDALPAAISGRIGSIVVDRESPPVWGRLDLTTLETQTHESHQPGDVDLLDRLVAWARANGGEVTPVDDPIDGRPFIATYRY